MRSLLDLYVSPAPSGTTTCALSLLPSLPKPKLPRFWQGKPSPPPPVTIDAPNPVPAWIWKVPPGTLSNAGRLVVLRAGQVGAGSDDDDVQAELTTDEQLRDVVFGDPMMHVMKLYCRRVEVLATKAVTARVWG